MIDAISDAIASVAGVSLLDVDPGVSTNRTVFTFVGDPKAIVEAAVEAAKAAFPLIDMRKHKGRYWMHLRQSSCTHSLAVVVQANTRAWAPSTSAPLSP